MADDNPLTESAWFAGFAAGESSFLITQRTRGNLAPCFVIGLRADDLAILEELQAAFGGAIHMTPARGRNRPGAYWTIASKRDMTGLVAYFDRFPLRAKKARDFAIWRRAVRIYCASGQRSRELWPLRDALVEGRKWEAIEPTEIESPQLRLVS